MEINLSIIICVRDVATLLVEQDTSVVLESDGSSDGGSDANVTESAANLTQGTYQ